jgi:hypothetical protein
MRIIEVTKDINSSLVCLEFTIEDLIEFKSPLKGPYRESNRDYH